MLNFSGRHVILKKNKRESLPKPNGNSRCQKNSETASFIFSCVLSRKEPVMPHVVVKIISGPSKDQLQDCADQIASIVNKTLGKPKKYISVSVEEYSSGEWPGVYNEYVKDRGNVLIKPDYTLDDI
jgi:phenylpyruvate tautomerase PptA (4-oxalocrotonate tautomerase family)